MRPKTPLRDPGFWRARKERRDSGLEDVEDDAGLEPQERSPVPPLEPADSDWERRTLSD